MRGKILLKALQIIEEMALTQTDFFAAVLSSGYGATTSKINYEIKKRQRERQSEKYKAQELAMRKQRLRVFIAKMKRDGLILEERTKLTISQKGKDKMAILKNKLPDIYYNREKQTKVTIISFDIPEKIKRKRNWLREVIKNLDFQMIHKSVWVGNSKIPRELIQDLERLKILEFIEVFEVSKTGTLRRI